MKKLKILALSLLAIGSISLTSCFEGPQGDPGEKGNQGLKGDAGDPGKDGKNGEDGEDGTSLLSGEGAPSSTLGNDGDSYVDTKTSDYYAKENGSWVKKGNMKGDKGDPGEKGNPGEKGDTGSKGDKGNSGASGGQGQKGDDAKTTYSNTIIPSTGGTIIPDKGSASTDEKITFYIVPDNGYSFKSITLNGKKYTIEDKEVTLNSDYGSYSFYGFKITVDMVENGYVVNSEFEKGNSIPTKPLTGDGDAVTEEKWKKAFAVDVNKLKVIGYQYGFYNGEYTCYGPLTSKKYKDSNDKVFISTNYSDYSSDMADQVEVYDFNNGKINSYYDNHDETWSIYNTINIWDRYYSGDFVTDEEKQKVKEYINSFIYYCPNFSDYYSRFEYSEEDKTYNFKGEYGSEDNGYIETNGAGWRYNSTSWYSDVSIKFDGDKISSIKYTHSSWYAYVLEFSYDEVEVVDHSNNLHEHTYESEYSYDSNQHYKYSTCSHYYGSVMGDNGEHEIDPETSKCNICGYVEEYDATITSDYWWYIFEHNLKNQNYANKVTLQFGDKEWVRRIGSFNSSNDNYDISYLNIEGNEYYYLIDDDNNELNVACKFYKENDEWKYLSEEQFDLSGSKDEDNWDYEYAFSYLPYCPNFSESYDKFEYDETKKMYHFEGNPNAEDGTIKANLIGDLTNSYNRNFEGGNYSTYTKMAEYYDISVKFNERRLEYVSFKIKDSSYGDRLIKVYFSNNNSDRITELPNHTHGELNIYTPVIKKKDEYNGYIYYSDGHYKKSGCLDMKSEVESHTYDGNGVCTLCKYDSRKVYDENEWNDVFYGRTFGENLSCTATVKWGEKTLVVKKSISSDLYSTKNLTSIEYNNEKWIISFNSDYDYTNVDYLTIYKSSDNGVNWSVEFNDDYRKFKNQDYLNYLLSSDFISPRFELDDWRDQEFGFEDLTYEDGYYKFGGLSLNKQMIALNVFSKYEDSDEGYWNYRQALYYDIQVKFTNASESGHLIDTLKFKVTDNDLFGNELVTINYSYNDVEITIPTVTNP